jgi:hypothetical protein
MNKQVEVSRMKRRDFLPTAGILSAGLAFTNTDKLFAGHLLKR